MTVAGDLHNVNVTNIMRTIRNYVINFFSCTSCAENFAKETADLDENIGDTNKDAILYLWNIHNMVNERLSKEVGHVLDPRHPKIQFPGKKLCENCRSHQELSEFDKEKVFKFLKKFYSTLIPDRKGYIFHNEVTGLHSNATFKKISLLLQILLILNTYFII